jgi:hypothetical protein
MSQRYAEIKRALRAGRPVDPNLVREMARCQELSDKQRKKAEKMIPSAYASNHQPPSAILYGPFYSTRWTIDD